MQWPGDAFVVRDAAASRTIGGGRVIDPRGRERHRRAAAHLDALRALEAPTPRARLEALLWRDTLGVDATRPSLPPG